jgi:hypothetical protein
MHARMKQKCAHICVKLCVCACCVLRDLLQIVEFCDKGVVLLLHVVILRCHLVDLLLKTIVGSLQLLHLPPQVLHKLVCSAELRLHFFNLTAHTLGLVRHLCVCVRVKSK